jgi:hypothetical protein
VITEEVMAVIDTPGPSARGIRAGAIGLAVAGILFEIYPAVRPYSDESTLAGAAAMASPEWLVAHLSAIAGFILLGMGLLTLRSIVGRTRLMTATLVTGLLGVGLTLPYYGAEVFGAHAIGSRALADHNVALMQAVSDMRFQPAAVFTFAAGLLLLVAGTILAAIAIWSSAVLPRWSGVALAVAWALFIPQYWGPPAFRIAQGLLITAGCVWVAIGMWRASARVAPAADVRDRSVALTR